MKALVRVLSTHVRDSSVIGPAKCTINTAKVDLFDTPRIPVKDWTHAAE